MNRRSTYVRPRWNPTPSTVVGALSILAILVAASAVSFAFMVWSPR